MTNVLKTIHNFGLGCWCAMAAVANGWSIAITTGENMNRMRVCRNKQPFACYLIGRHSAAYTPLTTRTVHQFSSSRRKLYIWQRQESNENVWFSNVITNDIILNIAFNCRLFWARGAHLTAFVLAGMIEKRRRKSEWFECWTFIQIRSLRELRFSTHEKKQYFGRMHQNIHLCLIPNTVCTIHECKHCGR